jgi:hypothetical protein
MEKRDKKSLHTILTRYGFDKKNVAVIFPLEISYTSDYYLTKKLFVEAGDKVKKGDVLAKVFINGSEYTKDIISPYDGVVLEVFPYSIEKVSKCDFPLVTLLSTGAVDKARNIVYYLMSRTRNAKAIR